MGRFAFSAVNIDERTSDGAPSFWVLMFRPLWRVREGDAALFCGRFCDLVNSITEEAWKGPEEGDCDSETLEVKPPSLKRRSLFHPKAVRTSRGQELMILLFLSAVRL